MYCLIIVILIIFGGENDSSLTRSWLFKFETSGIYYSKRIKHMKARLKHFKLYMECLHSSLRKLPFISLRLLVLDVCLFLKRNIGLETERG